MDTQIRNKILDSQKNFISVNFDYKTEKGTSTSTVFLKIREPSIAEVNYATNLRFTHDDKGNLKVKDDAHLDITIFYLVNLVTTANGEKLFELTDRDNLVNYPANSEIARLINEVWNVVRGDLTPKKPLETQKEV